MKRNSWAWWLSWVLYTGMLTGPDTVFPLYCIPEGRHILFVDNADWQTSWLIFKMSQKSIKLFLVNDQLVK